MEFGQHAQDTVIYDSQKLRLEKRASITAAVYDQLCQSYRAVDHLRMNLLAAVLLRHPDAAECGNHGGGRKAVASPILWSDHVWHLI